jgi:hypothetical protein
MADFTGIKINDSEFDAMGLPDDPNDSWLSSAGNHEIYTAAQRFREALVDLSARDLDVEAPNIETARRELEQRTGRYWQLLKCLGTYFAFCFYRCAVEVGPEVTSTLIRDHGFPAIDPSDDSLSGLMRQVRLYSSRDLLLAQDLCALAMISAAVSDNAGVRSGELSEDYDSDLVAIEQIRSLHETASGHSGELAELGQAHLQYALAYRKEVLKRRFAERQKSVADSTDSPLELLLLAARHDLMVEKFGRKRVERVFEQRIARLFQSFGFTTVTARPGEAVADLLCIARSERFTFLVDAKSTRGKYNLPMADQRALYDYVAEFSSALPDLPPLAFVLIVGPGAAGTVPDKLIRLEGRSGLPIKFIGADVLAKLRVNLPGPVLPKQFRDAVLGAGPILGEDLVVEMKSSLDGLVRTYSAFIDGLRQVASLEERT